MQNHTRRSLTRASRGQQRHGATTAAAAGASSTTELISTPASRPVRRIGLKLAPIQLRSTSPLSRRQVGQWGAQNQTSTAGRR